MTKWEYITITVSRSSLEQFQKRANELGNEGWELTSFTSFEQKNIGLFDSGSQTTGYVAIFKRPKL